MPTITDRKLAEMDAKMESLQQDFLYWRNLASERGPNSLSLHFSQINRLIYQRPPVPDVGPVPELKPTGIFEELRLAIQDSLQALKSEPAEVVIARSRVIEITIMGAHALWTFFRSKFAQRLDGKARPFLDAVSELSWSCYKPAREAAGQAREAPLIYLSTRWTPEMLGRGKRWQAVDSERFADEIEFQQILDNLPLSIISLPMVEMGYVLDGIFVAHETGHAVEQDFGLGPELKAAVGKVVDDKKWQDWCGEMFADAWAVAHVGGAYVGALQDFLAARSSAEGDHHYPPNRVRVRLNREMLGVLDLQPAATSYAASWREAGLNDEPSEWDGFLRPIAEALLKTSLEAFGGQSVMELAGPVKKREDAARSQAGRSGKALTERDPRILFAALRYCHEAAPTALTGEKGILLVSRFIEAMRQKEHTLRDRSIYKSGDLGIQAHTVGEQPLFQTLLAFAKKHESETVGAEE